MELSYYHDDNEGTLVSSDDEVFLFTVRNCLNSCTFLRHGQQFVFHSRVCRHGITQAVVFDVDRKCVQSCVCVCVHVLLHVCMYVCVCQHFFKNVCLTSSPWSLPVGIVMS